MATEDDINERLLERCRQDVSRCLQSSHVYTAVPLVKVDSKLDTLVWTRPETDARIVPPTGTVVMLADLRRDEGLVAIYTQDGVKYVDAAGTEKAGQIVMVKWRAGWWLRVSQSLRIGYICKA